MVDVKISGLPAKGSTMVAGDEFEINDAGTSKKITGQNIIDANPAPSTATDSAAGIIEVATNAEGITGTDSSRAMTASAVTAVLGAATTFNKLDQRSKTAARLSLSRL